VKVVLPNLPYPALIRLSADIGRVLDAEGVLRLPMLLLLLEAGGPLKSETRSVYEPAAIQTTHSR